MTAVQKREIKPAGFWNDINTVLAEAQRYMQEHDYQSLPAGSVMQSDGVSSLSWAISKHGWKTVRTLLGEQVTRVDNGDWKELSFTLTYAKKFMDEHGYEIFPSQNILLTKGEYSLIAAVHKYFGGFDTFRRQLGENPSRAKNGRWKDPEYVMDLVHRVMKINNSDSIPGSRRLTQLGHRKLAYAITHYHGGFVKFREQHNQKKVQQVSGYWVDEERVLIMAQEVLQAHHFDELPGGHRLRGLGYDRLAYAINKHHGGFPAFREKLRAARGAQTGKETLTSMLEVYVKK